ncbi:hypothetical protein D9M71_529930 [compost metagenome]
MYRGFSEPGAQAWIVAIVRFGLGLQQVQRPIIKTPLALHLGALAMVDALHQKCRARWSGETLHQLRVMQATHQQELAAGVTQIGGAEHAVGVQHFHQLWQPIQALCLGVHSRVVGKQANAALRRLDQAPGALVDRLGNLLGGIASSSHKGLANTAVPLPGQGSAEQQHAQRDGQRHQPLQ